MLDNSLQHQLAAQSAAEQALSHRTIAESSAQTASSVLSSIQSKPDPVQPPISRNAYDTISGTGLLNGSPTDSGGTWLITGPGFNDAVKNEGGYATSVENAYCHLQASAPIRRAVQTFTGDTCTLAIGLNADLTDMIHVNFSTGEYADVLFWKTGLGASIPPEKGSQL